MTQAADPQVSALQKLSTFYETLPSEEQEVIKNLVNTALVAMAEEGSDDDTGGFGLTSPSLLGGSLTSTLQSTSLFGQTTAVGDTAPWFRA